MMEATTPESGLTQRQVTERMASLFAEPEGDTPPEETEAVEVVGDDEESEEVEADEQGLDEEEDSESEDDEGPALYTVRVDGEEVQVTQDELLAGYSRQADYTRKTQALAEERKKLDSEFQQARQEREEYASVLPQLRQVLEAATLGAEPDWDRLFAEDPTSAARQQYEWRKRKEQIDAVRAEEQRIHQQRVAEQRHALQQTVAAERERLLSKIPEWQNQEVAQREQRELVEFGRSLGYSEQELAGVYDHRAVIALRNAMLYDRARSQGKAKAKSAKVKTAAPGTGSKNLNSKGRHLQAMRERAKSGRVDDIAPLMGALLSGS